MRGNAGHQPKIDTIHIQRVHIAGAMHNVALTILLVTHLIKHYQRRVAQISTRSGGPKYPKKITMDGSSFIMHLDKSDLHVINLGGSLILMISC